MKIKENNIKIPLVLSAVFFGWIALVCGIILSLLHFRLNNPLTFDKVKNILMRFNYFKFEYLNNGLELYNWQLAPFQNNASVMLSDLKLNDKQIQTIESILKNQHENLKKCPKYYIISIIIFSLICLFSTSFLLEVASGRCEIKDDCEEFDKTTQKLHDKSDKLFDESYDAPTSAEQKDRDDSAKNILKETFHEFIEIDRRRKKIERAFEDIEKIDFTEANLKSAILLKPLFNLCFKKSSESSSGSNAQKIT